MLQINDILPMNALQFLTIHIKLLHNDHLQGAVHILQKYQTVTLQCLLYLYGPDCNIVTYKFDVFVIY
jgi:hypothetical protein